MLVAYLDESYSKAFLCFAAVIADENAIRMLSNQLDDLMSAATMDFGVRHGAEIHGYPMFHGKDDWAGVGARARVWTFERTIDVILASNATLLFRGTYSDRLLAWQRDQGYANRHSREQVCFQHILERIDGVAHQQETYALVIADDRDDRESHRAHFESYRVRGTPGPNETTTLDRLLDTVYFAPSHPSRLLQAADILAFMYHRWNTQGNVDQRERDVMVRLWGKIKTSGNVHKPGNWP